MKGIGKAIKWLLVGLAVLVIGSSLVSALVNLGRPTHSELPDQLSADEQVRMAEAIRLRETLGEAVFPGWGEAEIPVVLYNEAYVFLGGLTDPPDGWRRLSGRVSSSTPWETVPGTEGNIYYRQPLPEPPGDSSPEAFAVRVGEHWAGSMATQEWMKISLANTFEENLPGLLRLIFPFQLVANFFVRGSDGYIPMVLHESFHAFQGMQAPDKLQSAENATVSQDVYPWDDPAQIEAWEIELSLLRDALQTESETEMRIKAQAFLDAREARRANLPDTLVQFERMREWVEGLAKYAELEIWRSAAEATAYQPLPNTEMLPDFKNYQQFDQKWAAELDQMVRMATDTGDGRFYYSGMAQAMLLDQLRPGWKADYWADGNWLDTLLAEALEK